MNDLHELAPDPWETTADRLGYIEFTHPETGLSIEIWRQPPRDKRDAEDPSKPDAGTYRMMTRTPDGDFLGVIERMVHKRTDILDRAREFMESHEDGLLDPEDLIDNVHTRWHGSDPREIPDSLRRP